MAEPRRLHMVSAAELAPLDAVIDPDYPERLREMATVIYLALRDQDPQTPPADMAVALTEALSIEMGGGSFYMHKGVEYRMTKRDRDVMREFNGRNIHLLARKYNLTEMRIRQIIAAQFDRDQGKLPGIPTEPPAQRPSGD